jgi:6-phosphogluconate dehydrogenase
MTPPCTREAARAQAKATEHAWNGRDPRIVAQASTEHYRYDFNLPDIAEVWRRGSVIASWLLDLTASALVKDPDLAKFTGRVSDSGEGRWTITAAIDEGSPAPALSAALYQRFMSRGEEEFADRVLSAMRFEFGGHVERPTGG